jgi:Xaa-Pro aminopeptidase
MLRDKIKKIQLSLQDNKLDGIILGNYGFNAYDDLLYYMLLRIPEYALIFIPRKGKPTLYAIPFEVNELKLNYPEFIVRPLISSVEAIILPHIKPIKNIGLKMNTLPASIYRKIVQLHKPRFTSFGNAAEIMAIKLPEEIKRLKKACNITDEIFIKLVNNWRKFKTEQDVANFILVLAAKMGVEPSFAPIVASGKNASNPHYHPQNKIIQKGFCVIDMGVRYDGYCSDMTRTVYVGKPSKKECHLYTVLLGAQMDTIKKVKTGTTTAVIDIFCRNQLGKLNKQFIHGLGHGLGTSVHEWPSVSKTQDVTLEQNMVVTVEPGLYLPNKYGIRIEDDVVVTKNKALVLNQSKKTLITV